MKAFEILKHSSYDGTVYLGVTWVNFYIIIMMCNTTPKLTPKLNYSESWATLILTMHAWSARKT